MATIVDGVRQNPVADYKAAYQAGDEVYLYNVGARMFYGAGNDWGTRASVLEAGAVVKLTETDAAKEKGEGIVELKSYVSGSMKSSFTDDGIAVWTDNDSKDNRFWTVTAVGDYYRIANTSYDGKFLGWDTSKSDTRVYLVDPTVEGCFVDWAIVPKASYSEFAEKNKIFIKAEELREAIAKAAAAGADVAAAQAIYANEASAIADIEKAISDVTEAGIEASINNASGENPADITAKYITNASYDNNKADGWSGDTPAFQSYTNAEFYNKNYEIYQSLSALRAGVYALGLQGFYRAGSAESSYQSWLENKNLNADIYVKIGDEKVTAKLMNAFDGADTVKIGTGGELNGGSKNPVLWIPNDMNSANAYCKAGRYNNSLFFELTNESDVRIGLVKSTQLNIDWTIFDNWSLTYYGTGADAYQAWAKTTAASYPTFANAVTTKSVLDAYLEILNAPAASNKQEALAYIARLDAAKEAVEKNISLWTQYDKLVTEARNLVSEMAKQGKTNDAVQDLSDYATTDFVAGEYDDFAVNGSASYIIQNRQLDNAKLEEEIAYVNELMDAVKFMDPVAGDDVTRYLTNPDFADGKNGWNGWGSATGGGNKGNHPTTGGSPNICAEAYDALNFDLYQVVDKNQPVGVYEISVQGFTRIKRNDQNPHGQAWDYYRETNGGAKLPVYVYLNANQTNIKDIHEEPQTKGFYSDNSVATIVKADGTFTGDIDWVDNNGYYTSIGETTLQANDSIFFPNTMTGASYAFTKGLYKNSAFGAVVNQGDALRIGVKGSTLASDASTGHWSIYDNFKLTFWGTQADKVYEALTAAIAEVKTYTTGRMGKNVVAQLDEALTNAEAVATKDNTDGEGMFAKLGALYEAKASVMASKELMDKLFTVNDSLKDLISAANLDALTAQASNLRTSISTRLVDNDITDSEVDGLLEQVRAYIKDINKLMELNEWMATLAKAAPTPEEMENALVTETWYEEFSDLTALLTGRMNCQDGYDPMTAAEVEGYIEQVKTVISKKYMPTDIASATDEAPVNCTAMLQSPNFSKTNTKEEKDQIEGWTVRDGYEGLDQEVFGYFNKDTFEVYQELRGLPAGVYEVKNKAYYRMGEKQADADIIFKNQKADSTHVYIFGTASFNNKELKKTYSSPVKHLAAGARQEILWNKAIKQVVDTITGDLVDSVYNDTIKGQSTILVFKDSLKNVAGEDSLVYDTLYIPNDVVSANAYFIADSLDNKYTNSVFVKVAEDGLLRLGMKKIGHVTNDWCIMDSFQLFYYGADSQKELGGDVLALEKPAEAATVLRTEFFNMGGMRINARQRGFIIMKQTLSNGEVVVKKMAVK